MNAQDCVRCLGSGDVHDQCCRVCQGSGQRPKSILERYRNAVAEKSRAEERLRTATQHIDTYECRNTLALWKREVDKLYNQLDISSL